MTRAAIAACILASTVTLGSARPVGAVDCLTSTALPTNGGLGSYLVQDTFESGDFRKWTRRVIEGDARAYVGTARRVDGACAGRLVVTSTWSSRGYVERVLTSGTDDVWLSGWFRVDREGGWGSNVPTWRVFRSGTRIADVFRQNGTGELWLRTNNGSGGWRYTRLYKRTALGTWHSVELHVYADWGSSDVDVRVDGTLVYHSGSHYLPAGRLDSVIIGAEHRRQVMDLWFDAAVIRAR